ncbi:Cell death protease [Blyttiomyces sp. JEL0837]|nr:Cell death protease [Blyttiomyces sp. JEL0837]
MKTLTIHAGLIPVNPEIGGSNFFLMIEAKNPQTPRKLLFWFNGGPGCSSMDGVFLENGPFIPNANGTLSMREHAWWSSSTVVFIDQPFGTGYSTVQSLKNLKSLTEVTANFRVFAQRFFEVFPWLKDYDLYLAGESYAGVYIPYFSHDMLLINENATAPSDTKFNLKGIAIGNGWMDPIRQYQSYISYAIDYKLVDDYYLSLMQSRWKTCKAAYANGIEDIKKNYCEDILGHILDYSKVNGGNCINMYDIRFSDENPGDGCGLLAWPPYVKEMKNYLSRDEVRVALHVPSTGKNDRWEECDAMVSHLLKSDELASYKFLPKILENVPVVLFNGQYDLICNWYGIYDMATNLTWNGVQGFGDAKKEPWFMNNVEVGWYQTARNLSFALIYNSSHMTPVDHPLESLDIFNRLINASDPSVPFVGELRTGAISPPIDAANPFQAVPATTPPSTTPPTTPPPTTPPAPTQRKYGFLGGFIVFLAIVILGGALVLYARKRLAGRPMTFVNLRAVLMPTFLAKRHAAYTSADATASGSEFYELKEHDDEVIFDEDEEFGPRAR